MEEIVMVPVPVSRLDDVYRALSGTATGGASPATAVSSEPIPPELLRRAYKESPEAMTAVFDFLAQHPDREVPTDEVAEGIGVSRGSLAGVLGAFGRRWANRYDQRGRERPYLKYWSAEHGMVVYRMSAETADTIRRLKNGRRR